jgi:exosortase
VTRDRIIEWAAAAAVIGLVVALFHFHGVTDVGYDPRTSTHSLFAWLTARWNPYSTYGNDFPHGWIGPLGCAFMLWRLRHELAAAPKRSSLIGLGLIILALLLHWVGARAQQTRISIAAFLLLAWAIPLHAYGWKVARKLIAPIGFLLFALQFDFVGGLATRMRTVAAAVSAVVLNGLGQPAVAAATSVGTDKGVQIDLALAPGGLRSLMWLGAGAYFAAWMWVRGLPRQLILLMAVPVAWATALVGHTVLRGLAGPGWADHAVFYYLPAAAGLGFVLHRLTRRAVAT